MIKTVELRLDDIDGKVADKTGEIETVRFMLDGDWYEMELRPAHLKALRKTCAEYIGHARKVVPGIPRRSLNGSSPNGSRPPGRTNSRTPGDRRTYADRKADADRGQEIRDWAKARGIEVKDRGRIAASIVAEFDLAH